MKVFSVNKPIVFVFVLNVPEHKHEKILSIYPVFFNCAKSSFRFYFCLRWSKEGELEKMLQMFQHVLHFDSVILERIRCP